MCSPIINNSSKFERPIPSSSNHILNIQSSTVFSSSIESKSESCLGGIWSSFTSFISRIWTAILSCFGSTIEKPSQERENNPTGSGDHSIRNVVETQAGFLAGRIQVKKPCFHMLWVQNASGERQIIHHKYYEENARSDDFNVQTAERQIAAISKKMQEKKPELIQVRWLWIEFDASAKQYVLQEGVGIRVTSEQRLYQSETVFGRVLRYFGDDESLKRAAIKFANRYIPQLSNNQDIDIEKIEM